MAVAGLIGLLVAFAGIVVSVVCLVAGSVMRRDNPRGSGETLVWAGHVAVIATCAGLLFCCLLLVYCFVSGDNSIEYVVKGRSRTEGGLGLLFRIAGLWEGREGSLLFWAWLISLFNAIVAVRNMGKLEKLDNMALLVTQLVLAGFVGILLFSEDNSPFVAMAESYRASDGTLLGAAALWGMNPLLEHWAMAVHPPATFIGYAGFTIPFAYAVAALIVSDASDAWVRKAQRYVMVAWWFLGIGIGLGSVWAYVVLGWGGYWGWDAVENASLLPWLVGVALIHSLTVYRQRGAFKRWSIFCACLAFAFVITGTFIARSGLIESVHAFSGDPVSINLFLALIIGALLCGIVGLALRWKAFAPKFAADEDIDSLMSREAAYYFNNVIMVVFALVVCYLTVSSALPSFLPFGGQAIGAVTYDAIARPLGVLYCLVLAVCPLLGWTFTSRSTLVKRGKLPAICALVVFVLLLVYFVTYLSPSYDAMVAAGGSKAETLLQGGPEFYYKGLSVVGFLVASLILFNTLFMIGRNAARWSKARGVSPVAGFFKMVASQSSTYGGYLAHLGIAVILVGLIGSSMYVTEKIEYLDHDATNDTTPDLQIQEFTLRYTGNSITQDVSGSNIFYTVEFDVFRGEGYVGHVAPSMQLVAATQQTKANAAVISFPEKDLFVVYRGVNSIGSYAMDVRVNPLINFVWAGFGLLIIGGAVAGFGRRRSAQAEAQAVAESDAAHESDQAGEAAEADADVVEKGVAEEDVADLAAKDEA